MKRHGAALLLILSSCTARVSQSCDAPWPGFHRTDDRSFWRTQARWIAPPTVYQISIDRTGSMRLGEGVPTSVGKVDDFLELVAGLMPRPFVTIRYEKGADCQVVDDVRRAMDRSFDCRTSDRCLQGPAPAWAGAR